MFKILAIIFLSTQAFSQAVLMIGDSHMATDFGRFLYHEVRQFHQDDLVIMGHASAAPKDWIGTEGKSFKNVIYHNAHFNSKDYPISKRKMKPDWHSVPKISQLLKDMRYRKAWKNAPYSKPDIVLIELGANDYKVISDHKGKVSSQKLKREYQKRIEYIHEMISSIHDAGAKCLWVGPPMGRKKDRSKQRTLYRMLRKAVGNKCRFFSSNRFKATKCSDGVHFNCPADRPEAKKWAKAVTHQLKKIIK